MSDQYPDEGPVTDIDEYNGDVGDERVPPHSIDLEKQVLGAMILSRTAIGRAVVIIDRQAFYRNRHREIFDAIVRLYEGGSPVDLALVADELERRGILEECGGALYLSEVSRTVGTSTNVEFHAKQLLEKAVRRRTISIASQLVTDSYESAEEIYESIESFLAELLMTGQRPELLAKDLSDIVSENIDRYEDSKSSATILPMATPQESIHSDMDNLLGGGLLAGKLYLLVAHASAGKTSLLAQVATQMAMVGQGMSRLGCLVLEDAEEFVSIIQAHRAMVDANWSLLASDAQRDDIVLKRLVDSAPDLMNLPVSIRSLPDPTLRSIKNWMSAMVMTKQTNVFIIDHMSAIKSAKRQYTDRFEDIIETLSHFARDNRVTIILSHHQNLEAERKSKFQAETTVQPLSYSDLKGGQSLSQHAYGIIALMNPHAAKWITGVVRDDRGNVWPEGQARLYILKNKNTGGGSVKLWWQPERRMFLPWDMNDMPQPDRGQDDDIPPPEDPPDDELPF